MIERQANKTEHLVSAHADRFRDGPGRLMGLDDNSRGVRRSKRTQAEAEAAVRVLIEWAGDNPDREGLIDTPERVARSYRELFAGYAAGPREYLKRTFEEVGGYDELVVLKDIRVVTFCEHHMLPVIGRAHVGYLPTNRVL
nr:GTP cyclohydrolase I [Methylocystis sp. SC2]